MDDLPARDHHDQLADVPDPQPQPSDRPAPRRLGGDEGVADLGDQRIGPADVVAGDVLDGDDGAGGQRVIVRDGEHARLAVDERADDEIRLVDGKSREHEVDLAAPQRIEPIAERELDDPHGAALVGGFERIDDAEQESPDRRRVVRPEAQLARDREPDLLRVLKRSDELAVDAADLLAEPLASGRERDAPARAMDELEAELVLEAAEALADARLCETEPIGGAAEVE